MATLKGVKRITDGTNDKLKVNGNDTELYGVDNLIFYVNGTERFRLPSSYTANRIVGANSGGTALEYKDLATGSTGTDFNIAHAANTITFHIPDASATNRGLVTTGTQTLAGAKTFSSTSTHNAIVLTSASGTIISNTSDGADNQQITIGGGGGLSTGRGAVLTLKGNEEASNGGSVILQCGDIGTAFLQIASFGAQPLYFYSNGLLRKTISAAGQHLISPETTLAGGDAVLLIQGDSTNSNARFAIESPGAVIMGGHYGGTFASKTATASGSSLLFLQAGGYDGSAQNFNRCRILFRAAATWSAGASTPSEISFQTTRISSITLTERMLLGNDGSLLLKSHDAYTGSGSTKITAAVNTTDATTTNLFTQTLSDNRTYKFEVQVVGRFNSTTAKGVIGRLSFGVYRNNGGSATIVGTRLREIDTYGSSGYTFDVDVSSNDVRVRVTGAASETVSWTAEVTSNAVSTSS